MKYIIVESLRRLMQMFFGMELFNFPGLQSLRGLFYRMHYKIGKKLVIEDHVRFYRVHRQKQGGTLKIGDNAIIARDVHIDFTGSVILGDNVTLSAGSEIHSHSHPLKKGFSGEDKETILHNVEIKDGTWIGAHAIILPGVTSIGPNSMVGAGAIVTKNVPPNTVVAGNPARIIRELDFTLED